tara:strand:- start:49 stop:477 length:429 start_codon:yes stop_codon:yes gene_type:complete
MENFKNKLRLICFIPIGALANLFAVLILFAISSLFFDWTFKDIMNDKFLFEKIIILVLLIDLPCKILGYKISYIIKPTNLTNKNFIIAHSFFIGLTFALNIGNYFWLEDLTMQSIGTLGNLLEIVIFIFIIKDRRFNLFNMS